MHDNFFFKMFADTINEAMTSITANLEEVKKVMGIKPDLNRAKSLIASTDEAMVLLAKCLVEASSSGLAVPPDVFTKFHAMQRDLVDMDMEANMCSSVLNARMNFSKNMTN